MKLEISTEAVTNAAGFLQSIQSDQSSGDVRWIVVKKVDGKLSLSNIGKTTTGSVVVHKEHAQIHFDEPIMIDFMKLFQLSRSLSDKIVIDIKDGWAFCRSGRSRFRVPMRTEMIPEEKSIKQISPSVEDVPVAWLRSSLEASTLALGKSYHVNLALNGIHVFTNDGFLIVESCDGTELFRSRITAKINSSFDLIVAKESLKAFLQVLHSKADSAKVRLYAHWNQLILDFGDTVVGAFTQTGSFPNIGKLIKNESDFKAVCLKKDVLSLLKRADIFEESAFVEMLFTQDLLTVKAQHADGGDFEESLPVKFPFNETVTMRIQVRNIIGCISEIDANDFMIRFDKDPSLIFVNPISADYDLVYMTALARPPSTKK